MRQRLGVAIALRRPPASTLRIGCDSYLLGEIGESTAVIPSTHIVEDVEELCSSMAIIDRAEILLTATPARAIAEVRGRVWRRTGAGKSRRSSANRR